MKGKLIVAVLTTSSSYARDESVDVEHGIVPDTVQWWIGATVWRIRTYGMDHDIHTHSLDGSLSAEDAADHTRRHYADLTQLEFQVEFSDVESPERAASELRAASPIGFLEVAPPNFAFWKPDDAIYRSQSHPK